MVDYGLVARTIRQVDQDINRDIDRQRSHEEIMGRLGLAGAEMTYRQRQRQGELGFRKAQFEQEQKLNEEITVEQAISELNASDEQKQAILNKIPNEVRGMIATRKNWASAYRNAIQKAQERQDKAAYQGKLLELEREKMEATKTYREKQLGLSRDQLEALKSYRGEQIGVEREKVGVARGRVRGQAGKKEFEIRKEAIRRAENDPDYMRARTNEEKEPIVQRYIDLIKGETETPASVFINRYLGSKEQKKEPEKKTEKKVEKPKRGRGVRRNRFEQSPHYD